MKISEIKQALAEVDAVNFRLPTGEYLPAHFHVTEVGLVNKHFIDCGGVERHETVANFQLWEAGDYDHRLAPLKFLHILDLSQKVLGSEDLAIEVEYQQATIGKFGLTREGNDFVLTPKYTACLAQDACGIPDHSLALPQLQVAACSWAAGAANRCPARPGRVAPLAYSLDTFSFTMTIAFFSDVHGNLPALEAVLADMEQRRPDMIFCLGDLVGYAPWPNEVVNEVRQRGIPTLAGNYDQGIGLASSDCGCAYQTDVDKSLGAQSIAYTNSVVGDDERRYLRLLPKHMRLDFQDEPCTLSLLMVHGSPRRINQYLFEDFPEGSFSRLLEGAGADILLFGHTHKPYHRAIPYQHEGETHYRHALNIGSVGKPKDGDPRAAYQLLHLDENTKLTDPASVRSELVRVEYDVEKAARAVEASPLPNEYADMLRKAY